MYHNLVQRNASALIQEWCVQDDGTMPSYVFRLRVNACTCL